MRYKNKWLEEIEVRTFDDLKEYAAERGEDAHRAVSNYWRRFKRKTIENRPLWSLVNPWGEVARLRVFIAGLRQEEWAAAKNVLDLYVENETLRRYRSLAEGEMHNFVPVDDYNSLKKEHERVKQKLAKVSTSLNNFQKEWEVALKASLTPKPVK